MFGGFRSTSEAVFGDLMKTFAKFNNKEIVRVGSKKEFNLTFRLCLLLLNVRNFVKAVDIQELPHHRAWMEEGVDYPRERQLIPELTQTITVQNKLENGLELQRMQEKFVGIDVASDDDDEQTSNKDDDEEMSNHEDDNTSL
jgi:hypothetical protein